MLEEKNTAFVQKNVELEEVRGSKGARRHSKALYYPTCFLMKKIFAVGEITVKIFLEQHCFVCCDSFGSFVKLIQKCQEYSRIE